MTEEIDNLEENFPTVPEGFVLVNIDQLNALVMQNNELKADVISLINVFASFSGLFSGKGNIMSLVPVITKMLNDKKSMAQIADIVPIIEKYTANTADGKAK